MKYLFGFFAGLLVGALAALAVLYFNPLTGGGSRARGLSSLQLSYSLPEQDALLLTHDEQLKLPIIPANAPHLWEGGVKGTILSALTLASDDGERAVATRISVPSQDTNLLLDGVLVDDYWLVTVPGRGGLFVHTVNNQWPLLKETVGRVDLLRQTWAGPATYDSTRGPAGNLGRVLGLSGEFAGRRGTAREFLAVDRYGPRGFEGMSGELALAIDDAPQAAAR